MSAALDLTHKCAERECPHFGQRTDRGCRCHQSEIEVARSLIVDLSAALLPFRAAYIAYTDTCRNWIGSGETSAERGFSDGERVDTAEENAHEAMAAITFEQLCAVDAALAKARGEQA
jgi:hypothetical protein